MLLESEKRWISENMSNANEVLSMSDPNDIITELALYSVSKMDKDDNPTEKTYEAEKIMDRLADDDYWTEWDGS